VALATALAAFAATAWATNESLSESLWIPAPKAPGEPLTPAPESSLSQGETVVTESAPAPVPAPLPERVMPLEAAAIPAPVAERAEAQPRITIEERRLTQDERIQATLMDLLAQAPNLSGKIGVESHDAVVTLSGWTTTSGQAHRAVRLAWSVQGVKDVQNEIRPRAGGAI
jgi:hypothetical protein